MFYLPDHRQYRKIGVLEPELINFKESKFDYIPQHPTGSTQSARRRGIVGVFAPRRFSSIAPESRSACRSWSGQGHGEPKQSSLVHAIGRPQWL